MKSLLTIISMAVILCFTVSCSDKEVLAELEAYRAQAKVEEGNKALFKNAIDALNRNDIDGLLEHCSDDLLYYNPSNTSDPLSKRDFAEVLRALQAAFPDSALTIEDLIAKGDKVIARISVKGTSKGEFQGIPATGNEIKDGLIAIDTIKNGKFTEIREENNQLSLMQQLGMELKPKAGSQSAIKPPPLP